MINIYSKELIGCILDKEHVSSFLGEMEHFFDEPTISVCFYDSTAIEDAIKKEFDEYDFLNLQIKTISIDLYKSDYSTGRKSQVKLSVNTFYNINSISVSSSNHDEFASLKTVVDTWIRNVTSEKRKKTIAFLKKEFFISLLATVGAFSFTIVGLIRTNLISNSSYYYPLAIILLVCYGLISGSLVETVKDSFPPTEIDIGVNIYSSRRKWIIWLASTVFIPFIFMIIQFTI